MHPDDNHGAHTTAWTPIVGQTGGARCTFAFTVVVHTRADGYGNGRGAGSVHEVAIQRGVPVRKVDTPATYRDGLHCTHPR